ncbi:pdx1 [Symbiodinium necroappetens]|uniref:Pdx1 protein n=1 Tax=Symbiodinium necroappetens TaxID=1628268 RepID=A0A812XJE7_9DINO|nr:pdx1 [Symbiodinium necroappetens]
MPRAVASAVSRSCRGVCIVSLIICVLLNHLAGHLAFAAPVGRRVLFRLTRCKEQLPSTIDVSAVRRKFIRLGMDGFLGESEEQRAARRERRHSFEEVGEFDFLFKENDKDWEQSDQTEEDRGLFAMHEEALVQAMEDGTIFWRPRINGDLSFKRLRDEPDPEKIERWARQQAKEGRKRRGKRRYGNLGKKR